VAEERIVPVAIEEEMRSSYIDYAMSVIVARALPDVRDGLKPVQRRILFAMREGGLTSTHPYRKSARVVGDVMGKYHPHGGEAIYDAMARLAQWFSTRYPLVDGQGNFGSIDGDPPGAQRYTEVRLAKIGEEMLTDIDKDTVDFMPNYDGLEREPRVLPARIPNLLVNGASGIAVGMATNIPPHNLSEVVDALCFLIDNPHATVQELMEFIKGPDFPTGGMVCGQAALRQAYTTGRGIITIRAHAVLEREGGRERIVLTDVPYQTNKARLLEQIATLVHEKKVEGIADLRDETDKEGIRVVIELRRGENANVILNQLYKHTDMQVSFGINMLALVDGQPRVLSLRDMLTLYLAHRKEVITRRTRYLLIKAQERAHILEGLKVALDNLDEVIKIIRSSRNAAHARERLMKRFEFSQRQAQAILDMRLHRLTSLEREQVYQEYLDTIKEIARLEGILASEQAVMNIVKEELLEIKERYGDERRTEIRQEELKEFSLEDLIREEEMVISISHKGYIKRMPVSSYRQQRRGGKGVVSTDAKSEDFIEHLFIASTHDYILFFTDKGRVYWLRVFHIPQAGRTARGKAIVNLIDIGQDERITAFLQVRDFEGGGYVFMATKRGFVKKTPLSAFSHPRRGGIIAVGLQEGDELIKACLTSGEDEIFLATKAGIAIRFKEQDVRPMGRTAQGVRGVTLSEGDEVVWMEPVREGQTILTVTEKGFGKRTRVEEYRLQRRGGRGIINAKIDEKNGSVVSARPVEDGDEVMIITARGMLTRIGCKGVPVVGRATKGVRLMRLGGEDRVVAVAKIAKED